MPKPLAGVRHVLALALCLSAGAVTADSWAPPQTAAYVSPTGQHVIRVIPGRDMGAVFGFAGSPRGPTAKAIVYRLGPDSNYAKKQEIRLLNPITPLFAAVADTGEFITLDNWHNKGIGTSVVVVYSAEGKVTRSLGLANIYSPAELQKLQVTTSSIWWRCESVPRLDAANALLEFMDMLGSSVEISLKTGDVKRSPAEREGC